jgi:ketosteroid isomerase-like protein
MSQNAEIVRRWLWAFENSDEAFAELTHPEVEWAPFEENHTVSHGLAGAMRIRSGWLDPWAEHHIGIEELIDAGEDVVAVLHLTARGAASGAEVDVHLYGQFKLKDAKIVFLYEHEDRDAALKAVGLKE